MLAATTSEKTAQAGTPLEVHVALLLVQVAFGTLAVEGKIAMGEPYRVSPPALAMARITGAAATFLLVYLFVRPSTRAAPRAPGISGAAGPVAGAGPLPPAPARPERVRRLRDVLALAALSLFGIVLNQGLFLAGLRRTSPVAATLLVATIPVFTALIGAAAGRDHLTRRGAAGVAIALAGVAALSGFALPSRGDALVLANAASYAVYIVFAKGPLARFGTLTVVAWTFGLGVLLFAPIGAAALAREAPLWSARAAGLVAFVVLVPTVVAYSLNAWALRRARPTLVTIYVYFQPIVVAGLAWVQLGQPIDAHTALGGLLILAGVGLVATAPKPPVAPAPRGAGPSGLDG